MREAGTGSVSQGRIGRDRDRECVTVTDSERGWDRECATVTDRERGRDRGVCHSDG